MSSAATGREAEAIDIDRDPPAGDAGLSAHATPVAAITTTAAPAAISRAGRRRPRPGARHRVDNPPCRLWEVMYAS
jgi:hypothetical protein